MQQQLEQAQQQMQQMQAENQSLRRTTTDLTNSLATMGTRTAAPSSMEQPPDSPGAIVEASRNTLGVPTGMALPT